MKTAIRLATEDSVDQVRCIGFATWPQTYGQIAGPTYVVSGLDEYWGAESIGEAIRSGNVYVAINGDEVIGMSQVDLLPEDLVMWKLYVLPGRQRSGIGQALLDPAKQRATEEGRSLTTE